MPLTNVNSYSVAYSDIQELHIGVAMRNFVWMWPKNRDAEGFEGDGYEEGCPRP